MNTNFDSLDRHTDWRKTHRHYSNTRDTDITFIVQWMNTAAGIIEFVCLMFFRPTDFLTLFHDTYKEKRSRICIRLLLRILKNYQPTNNAWKWKKLFYQQSFFSWYHYFQITNYQFLLSKSIFRLVFLLKKFAMTSIFFAFVKNWSRFIDFKNRTM